MGSSALCGSRGNCQTNDSQTLAPVRTSSPDQTGSPGHVATDACVYYSQSCQITNSQSFYYCHTAQLMCNHPYFSPWLWGVPQRKIDNIRTCLISEDQKAKNDPTKVETICKNPGNCFKAPSDSVIDSYHIQCYKQSGVSPSRFPGLNRILPLGNDQEKFNPSKKIDPSNLIFDPSIGTPW